MTKTEHHLKVTRTARYFSSGSIGPETKQVWYVLHGYGMLGERFLRWFDSAAAPHRLWVAPEGMHRFYREGFSGKVGASWMTKEDRLTDIADYVDNLDQLHQHILAQLPDQEVEVCILGFSQGAATATRWLCQGEVKADHFVLWSGVFPPDVPPDLEKSAFVDTKVHLVCGRQDEFITPERWNEQKNALTEKGLSFTSTTFEGTHRVEAEPLSELLQLVEG